MIHPASSYTLLIIMLICIYQLLNDKTSIYLNNNYLFFNVTCFLVNELDKIVNIYHADQLLSSENNTV